MDPEQFMLGREMDQQLARSILIRDVYQQVTQEIEVDARFAFENGDPTFDLEEVTKEMSDILHLNLENTLPSDLDTSWIVLDEQNVDLPGLYNYVVNNAIDWIVGLIRPHEEIAVEVRALSNLRAPTEGERAHDQILHRIADEIEAVAREAVMDWDIFAQIVALTDQATNSAFESEDRELQVSLDILCEDIRGPLSRLYTALIAEIGAPAN